MVTTMQCKLKGKKGRRYAANQILNDKAVTIPIYEMIARSTSGQLDRARRHVASGYEINIEISDPKAGLRLQRYAAQHGLRLRPTGVAKKANHSWAFRKLVWLNRYEALMTMLSEHASYLTVSVPRRRNRKVAA